MCGAGKRLRAIQEIVDEAGVIATICKCKRSGHFKVLVEGYPQPIFTSGSPSDHRSIKNFRARIKRVAAGGIA